MKKNSTTKILTSADAVRILPPSDCPRFLSAYSPKTRVRMFFTGPGKTLQSFKAECDINTIMARYRQTGILPEDPRTPRFLDCTAYDYQEAQLLIAGARSAFFALPAELRDRFRNDPAELVRFAEDPANEAELKKMGLELMPADAGGDPEGTAVGDAGKPGTGAPGGNPPPPPAPPTKAV